MSTSVSGMPCLQWASPSLQGIRPSWYSELHDASNHCRNPGELGIQPWCFTSDNAWEYCNVTDCVKNNIREPDSGGSNSPGGGVTTATVLSVITTLLVAVVLIGVAVAAIYVMRLRSKKLDNERQQNSEKLARLTTTFSDKYVTNPKYTKQMLPHGSKSVSIPESFLLIPKENIKYVSQLGQGNFGIVYKGRAAGIVKDEEEIEVAVKTLKEDAESEAISNFVEEAKLMFSFDHPNILKIFGVCMSSFPYLMVFEYMDEGDLTLYLRSHASSIHRRLLNPFSYRSRTESSYSNDPPSLSKTQLLQICRQVAAGMDYLSSRNHVHRDLACRNCLVSNDMTIKIGDFGMSKNLYSKDYYRVNGLAVLPVRWMSPEALIYGKFTIEGDVWSFGVVMWEVFSFALQPYFGISNEEVTDAIRHGKTLKLPEDCPSEIYELMKECWSMEPQSRPSFAELHHRISQFCQMADMAPEDQKNQDDAISYDSNWSSDAFLEEGDPSGDDLSVVED